MATNAGVHTLPIRTENWAKWVPDPFVPVKVTVIIDTMLTVRVNKLLEPIKS